MGDRVTLIGARRRRPDHRGGDRPQTGDDQLRDHLRHRAGPPRAAFPQRPRLARAGSERPPAQAPGGALNGEGGLLPQPSSITSLTACTSATASGASRTGTRAPNASPAIQRSSVQRLLLRRWRTRARRRPGHGALRARVSLCPPPSRTDATRGAASTFTTGGPPDPRAGADLSRALGDRRDRRSRGDVHRQLPRSSTRSDGWKS